MKVSAHHDRFLRPDRASQQSLQGQKIYRMDWCALGQRDGLRITRDVIKVNFEGLRSVKIGFTEQGTEG